MFSCSTHDASPMCSSCLSVFHSLQKETVGCSFVMMTELASTYFFMQICIIYQGAITFNEFQWFENLMRHSWTSVWCFLLYMISANLPRTRDSHWTSIAETMRKSVVKSLFYSGFCERGTIFHPAASRMWCFNKNNAAHRDPSRAKLNILFFFFYKVYTEWWRNDEDIS